VKKHFLLPLVVVLVLVGCSPPRSEQASAPTTNWFVSQFGDHRSPDGVWHVSVPAENQTFRLTRGQFLNGGEIRGKLTNTYSTDGWKAQSGWFIFVENPSQTWCYDGASFLWLLRMYPDGFSGSYGLRCFPCPVPPQVYARLSDSAQKAIEQRKH